jgi:hypothetical protein
MEELVKGTTQQCQMCAQIRSGEPPLHAWLTMHHARHQMMPGQLHLIASAKFTPAGPHRVRARFG